MPDTATRDLGFFIRHATPGDAALVLHFMKMLGGYQKMADDITATEDRLHRLLDSGHGEAFFGIVAGKPVGMLFFSPACSAFTGRSGLFIDAFVLDEALRQRGYGQIMMDYLSTISVQRGGEMLEWGCLDWNAPAIAFYQKMGAYCLDIMRIYRLSPDDLHVSAARF